MISKILIAVDGSKSADTAFEYACHLASKTGVSLLILRVSEELPTVGYSINNSRVCSYVCCRHTSRIFVSM
jgi:nucleotide-binding universal stress UspA family protein